MNLSPYQFTKGLLAKELFEDPSVQPLIDQLVAVTQTHTKKLTSVAPAQSQLQQKYQHLLDDFASARGGKLWYPYISSGIGNGALVELADGSVKYDFISGIGPHFFGHSHPMMIASSIKAALSDTIMQGHLQQSTIAYDLCKLLLHGANWDDGHCFLSTSGVMAVENGLKIAFQNRFPANRVLAFEKCFAGRTLAASQITDKAAYRVGLPDNLEVDLVPFFDEKDPEGSIEKSVAALRKHIARYPGKHAVFVMELIQGEGGFRVGSAHFFQALIDICKEQGILLMADEVQTFGRLPTLFAFQYFGLEQQIDIVSIGKVLQVCATLFRKNLAPKPGLLSQTFTGSTTSLYTGYTILQQLLSEDYLGAAGKIAKQHQLFKIQLELLQEKFPDIIEGPFGIGAMIAFTPFQGKSTDALSLSQQLFTNGLICFTAGADPTRIRFLPPVGALKEEDITNAMQIVERTIEEMLDNVEKS